jgi:hypothetical protein
VAAVRKASSCPALNTVPAVAVGGPVVVAVEAGLGTEAGEEIEGPGDDEVPQAVTEAINPTSRTPTSPA